MERSDETRRDYQKQWSTLEKLLRNALYWLDQTKFTESIEGSGRLKETILDEPLRTLCCYLGFFLDSMTSTNSKQYFVKGVGSGYSIEALPDSSANISLISNTLAFDLGLSPIPGTEKTIYLANKKPVQSPGIVTVPRNSKQYFVKGDISGHSIEALPDSGANISLISNTLAFDLGLSPTPGTEKTIYLANKKPVRSPGIVTVPWKFDGESGMYPLDCWILPKSIHAIVLGKPFLNATQTLKALASRIKCKIVHGPRRLRLQLLGGESENEKVWGYLNDRFTTAFPDTGSDVMLVSRKYAEELELDIDARMGSRVEVEFPDGSTAWTSGIIHDASWRVGSKIIHCDFHVFDELCVDVVLSNEYLFNENVFSECDIYFFDAELDVGGDVTSIFCNIRLIGRHGGNLNSLEEEYIEDLTSPDAFTDEKVQRELARRDKIRDEINELSEDQRDTARLDEIERQRQWEQKRQIQRNTCQFQSTSQQISPPDRTEEHQNKIYPGTPGGLHLSTWKSRAKKRIGLS